MARDRDKQAFATLFAHFAPRLKAWLIKGGAREHVAEEVAQEALLTLWHRATSYDRRKAAPSTWVFTIARNKRIDRLRKERRPTVELDRAAVPAASESGGGFGWDVICGEERRLKRELASLPEEQSLLLHKIYVEDKSHRVIADELNVALGTVKSRIRLAMTRLRAAFTETSTT